MHQYISRRQWRTFKTATHAKLLLLPSLGTEMMQVTSAGAGMWVGTELYMGNKQNIAARLCPLD